MVSGSMTCLVPAVEEPMKGRKRAHRPTTFSIPSPPTVGCVMSDVADLECENLSKAKASVVLRSRIQPSVEWPARDDPRAF